MTLWRHANPQAARRHREQEKERWHRDAHVRARHKAKSEQYRRALKHAALVAYGNAVCVCCGEKDELFLTLDHVNNDGAAHRRQIRAKGFAGVAFYSYLRVRGFPNRPPLQVLCYNCNCGRRANKGLCPHKAEGDWQ